MSFNCLPQSSPPSQLLHNNKQAKKRSHNARNKSESRRRRRSRRIPEITIATSTSDLASNVQAKTNANKFLTRHFIVELVTLLNAPIARNLIAKVIDLKCSQEVLKFGLALPLPLPLPLPLFPNLFCDLIKCSAPVIDLSHLGAISDRLGSDLGIGIMTAYRILFLMKPFPCLLHSISFAVLLVPAPSPSPAIDLFRCSPVDHLAWSWHPP